MVRLVVVFLFLFPFYATAQNEGNPLGAGADEWNSATYTQEDKIYNRSVWTFVDNPALAGFDRKLNISYRYVAEKLNIGYNRPEDNFPILQFQQHHAGIDAAFGGENKNWGVGAAYSRIREGNNAYHRVVWSHSYKIHLPKGHRLLFGHGVELYMSSLDWDALTFGDMIDPRYGFVYQTNEIQPNTRRAMFNLNFGMRYSWKRLAFDYVFQNGPDGLYAFAGGPDPQQLHRLKILYHFYVDDDITITPGFVMQNNRVNVWRVNPIASVTYQDMLYGQIGFFDFNRLQLKVGYQFQNHFTIEIGASAYTDQTMAKVAGLATAEAGIRYQLSRNNK